MNKYIFVFIAVLSIFVISCEKITENETKFIEPGLQIADGYICINEIGTVHNTILDDLIKENNYSEVNLTNISEVIDDLKIALVNLDFDSEFIDSECQRLLIRIQSEFSNSDFVFTEIDEPSSLEYLLELDYSSNFNEHLLTIYDYIENSVSQDSIDDYIDNIFMSAINLTSAECEARDVFYQIYYS
jgi:hypothetical protein